MDFIFFIPKKGMGERTRWLLLPISSFFKEITISCAHLFLTLNIRNHCYSNMSLNWYMKYDIYIYISSICHIYIVVLGKLNRIHQPQKFEAIFWNHLENIGTYHFLATGLLVLRAKLMEMNSNGCFPGSVFPYSKPPSVFFFWTQWFFHHHQIEKNEWLQIFPKWPLVAWINYYPTEV